MTRPSRFRLPPLKLTAHLARRWPRLNLVERGDELEKILALGFSRRALALSLSWSEGTIRRNLKLSQLPVSTRAAIMAGCSAKRILNAQRRGLPLPKIDCIDARRALEQRWLDRGAQEVLPWLQRHLPWAAYQEQFLTEVDRRLGWLPDSNNEPLHPSSSRFAIGRCRPRRRAPTYGPDLLEYLLEWFIRWAERVLASHRLLDELLASLRRS